MLNNENYLQDTIFGISKAYSFLGLKFLIPVKFKHKKTS